MPHRTPSDVIDHSDTKWHWDRKVPIALIGTIIITIASQSITALWWASEMDSRVEMLEKQTAVSAPQADRLTKVETRLEAVQSGISEIKDILRQPPVRR